MVVDAPAPVLDAVADTELDRLGPVKVIDMEDEGGVDGTTMVVASAAGSLFRVCAD